VIDTIYALATPPGRGAVAVLRLSGPQTRDALAGLGVGEIEPRRASLRRLLRPSSPDDLLDEALVLWFPGPGSYTGEDSAELQLHGGRAVVEAVSAALADLGLRLAEPGEFTRRAFQNGKLDLTQAEAVADLVDAETEAQKRQALAQLDGALGRRYEAWRRELAQSLAWLEAAIDFPDEDLPMDLALRVSPRLQALAADLTRALAEDRRGVDVRDGYRIALVGAPNAGKSSLFNGIVGREAAIVAARPGTTRDVIEAAIDLDGYRVVLADMAGLRATEEEIEAEGVRRARAWADGAALRLWVVDASAVGAGWREGADLLRAGDLCVLNKRELRPSPTVRLVRDHADAARAEVVDLSAVTGEGLDALRGALRARVVTALGGADFPATTRLRHRLRLREALSHVERGIAALSLGAELAAEDLRLAARALERVTGRVDAEDVLDVVFASFCIGK
jgi:tRNA modification GTPase